MGTSDGSIIATIITVHMPRNAAAAPGQLCPGMRIHAIDIVQPPGIDIPAAMDPQQATVTAALAAKSSAEMPSKAGRLWSMTSARPVLVVAPPPDGAGLVAPARSPVEP